MIPRGNLPRDWHTWVLVRSYALEIGEELYRVEVRRHPIEGGHVKATFRIAGS